MSDFKKTLENLSEQDVLREAVEDSVGVQEKIDELKNEVGEDFCHEARIEFLEKELYILADLIKDDDLLNKAIGCEPDKNDDVRVKYKKYYLELAMFKKPQNFKKGERNDELVQRAREHPLQDLIGSDRYINSGGGRFKCKCPFHNEKSPSFVIYPDNSYHCFGCQAHGNNAIDYVMKRQSLNFKEAIKFLTNTEISYTHPKA